MSLMAPQTVQHTKNARDIPVRWSGGGLTAPVKFRGVLIVLPEVVPQRKAL